MRKIGLWIIGILIVIYIGYGVVLTSFSVNVTAKEQCYNETFECYRKCGAEDNKKNCLLFKQGYWKGIFLWGYSFVETKIKDIFNKEEFSEYGLVHWPNGTITLEDFEKEGNILIELNIEQCNSPEKACVPVIVKEDGKLYTPYEYNETPYDDKKDRYTYYTDLETFHKVTGLKEATSEYVEGSNNVYFFDPYVKFYKTNEEREAILKEKIENQTIEEENTEKTVEDNKDKIPVLDTDIETLIKSFTGNIINGDDLYDSTQKKVYSVYTEITGNNTLYYNKDYDFFLSIGEKWKGGVMESAYEGVLTSIRIRKDNNIYGIRFKEKEICRNVDCFVNDEKIGENEKYIFTVPKEFYKHRSGIILGLI